ncbi:MAG: hypothetical protein HZA77_04870 [Candidatus Schekmanbacteria bacterium]|nr:hypothetical protein [Candidatus Schekmanbacteria bacterium]
MRTRLRLLPLLMLSLSILTGLFLLCPVETSAENAISSNLDEAIFTLDAPKLKAEAEKLKGVTNPEGVAELGKIYFKLAEYYELKSPDNKGADWDESELYVNLALETLRKAGSFEKATFDTHFYLMRTLIYRVRHYGGGMLDVMKIMPLTSEATKEVETMAKLEPGNPLISLARGIQALYKPEFVGGGIAPSVAELEKALKSSPDNSEILYWLGRAYSYTGAKGRDSQKAKEYLEKAMQVNPKDNRFKMELQKIKI